MSQLLERLQDLGFIMPFTERLGPCDQCSLTTESYWLPTEHRWLCEDCVYTDSLSENDQA